MVCSISSRTAFDFCHGPFVVTVHRQAFSEPKMPYDTVVVADFADLECEASAKSVTGTRYE